MNISVSINMNLYFLNSLDRCLQWRQGSIYHIIANTTGDPLHSGAACTQPCNVNTHSRANCSPGARLCEQWGHGCVNNGARLCAIARLCRGSPVNNIAADGLATQRTNRISAVMVLTKISHIFQFEHLKGLAGYIPNQYIYQNKHWYLIRADK